MPTLTISEDTYQRLSERAAALHISVDEFVRPLLDQFAEYGGLSPEIAPPLEGDAWLAAFEAWKQNAANRDDRYPPGFVVDDSRESMYREREDAQL